MLTRWDPYREMMIIRNRMDRRLNDEFSMAPSDWKSFKWGIALDVAESDDEYVVKASLPGINPDDLEITFVDNQLTIKGEVKEDHELDEAHYHLRERRYGAFSRSIKLPSGIESDQIEAKYDAGVLKLHLPKVEEVKPKKITITNGASKVIDAEASEVVTEN
jgi:HSP20 family protein